jgi:hypothetical protein
LVDSNHNRPAPRETWSVRLFAAVASTGPAAANRLAPGETWSVRPFAAVASTGPAAANRLAPGETLSALPFAVVASTGPAAANRLAPGETSSALPFAVVASTGPPARAQAPRHWAFLSAAGGPGLPAAPGTGSAILHVGADRARAVASLGSRLVPALAA